MYDKSSKYYDIVFSNKKYKEESSFLKDYIINQNPNAQSLLNLACGTGNHETFFKDDFSLYGLDFNEYFIEVAKKKNPFAEYYLSDMTDYCLNKNFDVITCLFSSIANLEDLFALEKMIECSVNHLKKNGLLLIEPFLEPHKWIDNLMLIKTYDTEEYKYSILAQSKIKDQKGLATEFHTYLDKNGFDAFKEIFTFSLFKKEEIKDIFKRFELKHDFISNELFSRGLHIGILE